MAAEVDFRLSDGAANSDPSVSLGGVMSSVAINNDNNLTTGWPT